MGGTRRLLWSKSHQEDSVDRNTTEQFEQSGLFTSFGIDDEHDTKMIITTNRI